MRLSKDLVAASATPMVLLALSTGPDYGYSILRTISDASDGRIEWSEGLLYPLLHRLERTGLISAQWGVADNGRRRKYYALTPDGASELADLEAQWDVAVQAISALRAARAHDGAGGDDGLDDAPSSPTSHPQE